MAGFSLKDPGKCCAWALRSGRVAQPFACILLPAAGHSGGPASWFANVGDDTTSASHRYGASPAWFWRSNLRVPPRCLHRYGAVRPDAFLDTGRSVLSESDRLVRIGPHPLRGWQRVRGLVDEESHW